MLRSRTPGPPQRLEFTGEHEYYTNSENHDPLGFALEIAADGRISVIGIEPKPLPQRSFKTPADDSDRAPRAR